MQRRLDNEYPEFTQAMLETVYPEYLAPLPSMAVVRMIPDFTGDISPDGSEIKRHFTLHSERPEGVKTRCTFRTAHPVKIYPFELCEAEYHV